MARMAQTCTHKPGTHRQPHIHHENNQAHNASCKIHWNTVGQVRRNGKFAFFSHLSSSQSVSDWSKSSCTKIAATGTDVNHPCSWMIDTLSADNVKHDDGHVASVLMHD
jgi:hypothetical protein